MRSVTSRATRARPGIALLLVLFVVALGMVHAALPLHLHHGAAPGLYNEEHVLAAIDSVPGDAPLPAGAPQVGIAPAPRATPIPPDAPPASPLLRSTQSRAPPLA